MSNSVFLIQSVKRDLFIDKLLECQRDIHFPGLDLLQAILVFAEVAKFLANVVVWLLRSVSLRLVLWCFLDLLTRTFAPNG
jgi:hypothetical protein